MVKFQVRFMKVTFNMMDMLIIREGICAVCTFFNLFVDNCFMLTFFVYILYIQSVRLMYYNMITDKY